MWRVIPLLSAASLLLVSAALAQSLDTETIAKVAATTRSLCLSGSQYDIQANADGSLSLLKLEPGGQGKIRITQSTGTGGALNYQDEGKRVEADQHIISCINQNLPVLLTAAGARLGTITLPAGRNPSATITTLRALLRGWWTATTSHGEDSTDHWIDFEPGNNDIGLVPTVRNVVFENGQPIYEVNQNVAAAMHLKDGIIHISIQGTKVTLLHGHFQCAGAYRPDQYSLSFDGNALSGSTSDNDQNTNTPLRFTHGDPPAITILASTPTLKGLQISRAEPPLPSDRQVFFIFFDWCKANVTPEGKNIVQLAFQQYKANLHPRISVSGYSDASEDEANNGFEMSEKRAITVAELLHEYGVPLERLKVFARGSSDLRVPTRKGVHERENRIVELALDYR